MKTRELFAPLNLLLLSTMTFISFSVHGDTVQINKPDYMASRNVGAIELFHDDDNGFYVIKDGVTHEVRNYNVDVPIRSISNDDLIHFFGSNIVVYTELSADQLAELNGRPATSEERKMISDAIARSGYIYVSQRSDGEYVLRAHNRLRGGSILPQAGRFAVWSILGIGGAIMAMIPSAATAPLVVVTIPTVAAPTTAILTAAGIVVNSVELAATGLQAAEVVRDISALFNDAPPVNTSVDSEDSEESEEAV